MLEAAGRHGKLQCFFIGIISAKAIDQSGTERISAAHTVHDIPDLIVTADIEFFTVIDAGCPSVVIRTMAFTKGHRYLLHIRIDLHDLFGQGLIFTGIQATFRHIHINGQTQGLLAVFFVSDHHVSILRHF